MRADGRRRRIGSSEPKPAAAGPLGICANNMPKKGCQAKNTKKVINIFFLAFIRRIIYWVGLVTHLNSEVKNMKTTRKALPILTVLNKLNRHFKKLYCYPSQKKLLELLGKFTSLDLSRRQLNYDLAALEKHGYIRRIQRHRRTRYRGMEFRSTLYEITLRGYNLLFRAGIITWDIFIGIKNIILEALKKREKPAPRIGAKSELIPLNDIIGEMLGGVP